MKHIISIVLLSIIVFSLCPHVSAKYAEDEPVYVVNKGSYWHFHHYFHDYYVDKRGFQIGNNLTDRWAKINIGLNFTWNDVNISRITGGLDFRWRANNETDMAYAIGRDIIFQNENYWVIFYIYYRILQTQPYMRISVGMNCSFPNQWNVTNPVLFYRMENISISGSPEHDYIAIPENNGTNIFLPSDFSFDYNTTIHPLQISLWDNVTDKFVEFLWNDQFWFNGNMHNILNHTVRGISNMDSINGIVQVEWRYANKIPSNTLFYHTWFWLDPTEVRYFRSDTANVNGLNTEKLRTSRSNVAGTRYKQFSGAELEVTACSLGSRVWARYDNSSEFEVSSGTPIAQVTRTSVGSGIMSNTWNCPLTSMEENCSVVVRVYTRWRLGSNPRTWFWSAWQLLDTWQTERLNTSQLDADTWTFYYWFQWQYLGGYNYKSIFKFDSATYNSRIADFSYTEEVVAVWNLVESWIGEFITRFWNLVEFWNGEFITRFWNLVEFWNGEFFTRAWNLAESWIGKFFTREWNLVETWVGELFTKGWNLIESWIGKFLSPSILIDYYHYNVTEANILYGVWEKQPSNVGRSASGQTFYSNQSYIVTMASFWLVDDRGNPNGTYVASLYEINGTSGTDGKPLGSLLAMSEPVNISDLSGSTPTLYNFVFNTSQRHIINEGYYCISLECFDNSSIDSSNYIYARGHWSNPSGKDDGNWFGYWDGWYSTQNRDVFFRVYGIPIELWNLIEIWNGIFRATGLYWNLVEVWSGMFLSFVERNILLALFLISIPIAIVTIVVLLRTVLSP